jgi:hypothetical protein
LGSNPSLSAIIGAQSGCCRCDDFAIGVPRLPRTRLTKLLAIPSVAEIPGAVPALKF